MSRKIIAWIGGLSLVAMGILAVGGIVALRLLADGAESRTVTGVPALSHLYQVASGQPAAAASAAKGADGVVKAGANELSADHARKDCMDLLAKDGHTIAIHKALKIGPGESPLAFTFSTTGLPGMDEGGRAPLVDPMATVATELGLTTEALNAALEGGKSLKDLAAAKGKTLEQLEAAAQTAAQKDLRQRLQAQVDSGDLTAEQADTQAAGLKLKLLDDQGEHHGLKVAIELGDMGRMIHGAIGKALHGKDGLKGDDDVVIGMTGGAVSAEGINFKLPEPMSQTDQDAVKAVLEQAVKAGSLSRAQADAAIARLAGPSGTMMIHAIPGMPMTPAMPAIPGMPLAPAMPAAPIIPAAPAAAPAR